MGGGQSKKYLSESELSNAESDSEWFNDNSNEPVRISEIQSSEMLSNVDVESEERTDAALRSASLPITEHVVTLENVRYIENELDLYEIVSMIYLLYDTRDLALQELQLLINSDSKSNLLYKWANNENYTLNRRWQEKLVEALCIIQNYKILRDIGLTKVDLISKYMPYRAETSCFVNKKRKVFYLIAEKLSKDHTIHFIHNMKKKLREKQIELCTFDYKYLELHFLHWEEMHLNIDDVKNTFKIMGLEGAYDLLNSVIPPENYEVPVNTNVEIKSISSKIVHNLKPKVRRKSTTRDTTHPQPKSIEEYQRAPHSGLSGISQEGPSEDINGYSIDPDNPGTLLIINQEEFYTELDPKYKDLLHEDNFKIKLETREGTMMDKTKLENVFKRRGFRIITKENLPHYDVINTIKEVVMTISFESSLIVCVLSHGDNGVVYGANSCRIDVNQIQNIICKKNKGLRGKPKILILQSCQGKHCQKIEESTEDEDDENANATDGPSAIPSTADLLTFWATIPGFAAIRNKNKGSWLIQELCEEIERLSSRYHFLDICTKVVEKVTSKEWKEKTGTNIMTPMVVTTLRKPFYLPALRNIQ